MMQNLKTQREWRHTWEAQSHSPNLRLFLFDSRTNPKVHCKSLDVSILLGNSQLLVTWIEEEQTVSLRVPVPKVLLDADSHVTFRALDDHIEVRLVLLLPVDHSLVSDLGFVTKPLVMDCDVKTLSSMGGVHVYCRICSTRLTKRVIVRFSEMPSSNWRESADNWFGNCCCSFGGISEKMVANYTNSYTCSSGLCLLSATTLLLSKDDVVHETGIENRLESNAESCENVGESIRGLGNDLRLPCIDKASMPGCCVHDSSESFQQLTLDEKFLLLSKDDVVDEIGIENQLESSSRAESCENVGESIHGLNKLK